MASVLPSFSKNCQPLSGIWGFAPACHDQIYMNKQYILAINPVTTDSENQCLIYNC